MAGLMMEYELLAVVDPRGTVINLHSHPVDPIH